MPRFSGPHRGVLWGGLIGRNPINQLLVFARIGRHIKTSFSRKLVICGRASRSRWAIQ